MNLAYLPITTYVQIIDQIRFILYILYILNILYKLSILYICIFFIYYTKLPNIKAIAFKDLCKTLFALCSHYMTWE